MTMSEESEGYKALYEEVCRQHDGITDFRAKLLGFLPLASGAAILLLPKNGAALSVHAPHLLAIGMFGILVTMGLFVHEIRGIEKCVTLIKVARSLEKRLSNELEGAFRSKRPAIEMRTPARIIYFAVALAWAYIAVVGAVSLPDEYTLLKDNPIIYFVSWIVPFAFAFGFVSWGWKELNKGKYQLEDAKAATSE
jgi:hypothetical protein